jgi:hypothetical protein
VTVNIYFRFELVEREPSMLEQNIKVVREEVANVASQLQEVINPK